ncbi:MAG: hypothetical protein NTY96_05185 [Bacteroidetes bacterium]|nr:hypothetical protein [Bacteroidota bacterium]
MSHVRTNYIVYNHNGGGVRHHHFSSSNYIIETTSEDFPGATNGTLGSSIAYGWPRLQFEGNDVQFAFMSVHGAADGNHLYPSSGNQPVQVGSSDIDVLVVYAPPGGINVGGKPGIWVDAFDLDTGNFSDDLNFISILTPPTPPDHIDLNKTTFANSEGEVCSVTAEHIRASTTIDGGVPFIKWEKIAKSDSIVVTKDFDLAQNETGEIWFAFYQSSLQVSVSQVKKEVTKAVEEGFSIIMTDTGPIAVHGVHGNNPEKFTIAMSSEVLNKISSKQKKEIEVLANNYQNLSKAAVVAINKAYEAVFQIINTIK